MRATRFTLFKRYKYKVGALEKSVRRCALMFSSDWKKKKEKIKSWTIYDSRDLHYYVIFSRKKKNCLRDSFQKHEIRNLIREIINVFYPVVNWLDRACVCRLTSDNGMNVRSCRDIWGLRDDRGYDCLLKDTDPGCKLPQARDRTRVHVNQN